MIQGNLENLADCMIAGSWKKVVNIAKIWTLKLGVRKNTKGI